MATSYPKSNTVLVTIAGLAFLSAPAEAEQCRAKQIKGRWALYLSNQDECLIRVRGTGLFSGECRSLEFDSSEFVDGILRLSRSCALSGGFTESNVFVGSLQPNGQGGAGVLVRDRSEDLSFALVRRP